MIKKKREITLSGILFAIFFAALLYPPFVSEELLQNEVLASYANWIALGAGVCFLLFNIREIRIDSFFLCLAILCFVMAFSTTSGRGDIGSAVSSGVKYTLVCLVVSVISRNNFRSMVGIVAFLTIFFLLLNFSVYVLISGEHPEGIRIGDYVNMWFLGNKNTIRNYAIPALTFMLIWEVCLRRKRPSMSLATLALVVASLIVVDSVTPLVVIVVVGGLYALASKGYVELSGRAALSVFLLAAALVFFAPMLATESGAIPFLNRDLTYSGRTYIWGQAMDSAINNPFFGVGLQQLENQGLLDVGDYRHVNHAHNALIDMQYKYGVFALALAAALLIKALRALKGCSVQFKIIMSCSMLAFLLCGLFGELSSELFLLTLLTAFYAGSMQKKCSLNGGKET